MEGTPAEGLLLSPVLVGAAARRPGATRTDTKAIVLEPSTQRLVEQRRTGEAVV
jgi:hypothetical protein